MAKHAQIEVGPTIVVEIAGRHPTSGPATFWVDQNIQSHSSGLVGKRPIAVVAQKPIGAGRVAFIYGETADIEIQIPIPVVVQPEGISCSQTVGQVASRICPNKTAPVVAQQHIVRPYGQKQILVAVVVVIGEDGSGTSICKMEI